MQHLIDRIPASFTLIDDVRCWPHQQLLGVDASLLPQLKNANVAIHGGIAHLLRWCMALDGYAAQIHLVPQDACQVLRQRFVEQGKVAIVVAETSDIAQIWQPLCSVVVPKAVSAQPVEISRTLETRWVIATSGTTSTPKLVAHTFASISRTVATADTFRSLRWGLLYDAARFAGIQLVLQSLLSGAILVAPAASGDLVGRLDFLKKHACDALSATPTLWRKILMLNTVENKLPLKYITLGGEISDDATLAALKQHYSAAKITHVYASTEAGVGFSVSDGRAGFPASYLREGVRGARFRISAQGHLELQPTSTPQHYLATDELIEKSDRWIDTGDIVQLQEDRVFFIGRSGGSINIGGNKVMPEEIENTILQIPGVFAVLVRAKESAITGALIEALVVPAMQTENPKALPSVIRNHCREKLAAHKVPALIKIVSELPISAAGKVLRKST